MLIIAHGEKTNNPWIASQNKINNPRKTFSVIVIIIAISNSLWHGGICVVSNARHIKDQVPTCPPPGVCPWASESFSKYQIPSLPSLND